MLALDECRQLFCGGYALRQAARQGHVEDVRALLASGTPPDTTSRQQHRLFRPWIHGRTALWHAVAHNHLGVVELLLSQGANPNLVGWMSATPLWTACCLGRVEMVVRLLAAGADPNLPGCRGSTPLLAWMGTLAIPCAVDRHYAPHADEHLQIGQLLNAAGASLDGVDEVIEQAMALLRQAGYPESLLHSATHLQALRAEHMARLLDDATGAAPATATAARL